MRKVISLILAASIFVFATSALAFTNSINTTAGTRPRSGGNAFATSDNAATMPCFRSGDTLSFNLNALTADTELTVISYKLGQQNNLSDATVQYINQYSITSNESRHIEYTIRGLDSGKYVLKFNDSANEIATFYYKVGNPQGQMITPATPLSNGSAYVMQQFGDNKWSIGFIGKITLNSTDVSFGDIDARPGFRFTEEGVATYTTEGLNGATLDTFMAGLRSNGTVVEIAGSWSVIYGVTMYNIDNNHQNLIEATPVVDVRD